MQEITFVWQWTFLPLPVQKWGTQNVIESVQRRTCCTWRWLQERQSPVAVLKSESCGSALKILQIHVVSFKNLSFIGKGKEKFRGESCWMWIVLQCYGDVQAGILKTRFFFTVIETPLQMFCGFMFKKKKMSVISKKLVYIVKRLHLSSSYLLPKVRMFSP